MALSMDGLIDEAPARPVIDMASILAVPAMPPEAPLDMPTQSLRHFDPKTERRAWQSPIHRRVPWLARLVVFGGAALLLGFGIEEMYRVVNVGEVTLLKWILVGLFAANFSWIALSFSSAVVGFAWLVLFAPKRPAMPSALDVPDRRRDADLQRGAEPHLRRPAGDRRRRGGDRARRALRLFLPLGHDRPRRVGGGRAGARGAP